MENTITSKTFLIRRSQKSSRSKKKKKSNQAQGEEDDKKWDSLSDERKRHLSRLSNEADKLFAQNFAKIFSGLKNDPNTPWAYPITVRSFHPKEGFGNGSKIILPLLFTWGEYFHGDNRGFSLDENASSAITYELVANPVKGIVYEKRKKSHPTIHPNFRGMGPKSATESPSGEIKNIKTGENTVSFGVEYSRTNALLKSIPFVLSLDVDRKLKLSIKGNILDGGRQIQRR